MKLSISVFTFLILLTGLSHAQTWTAIEDMPGERHHPVTFSLDGLGYAVTGSDNNYVPSNTVYQYDPVADSWTTLSNFPGTRRSFAIGDTWDGKAYMGFGFSTNSYLDDIWVFDPDSSSWTQLTTCPCEGRRHPAFEIQDGKITVGLGDGPSGNLNDWWVYDIANDSWSNEDDLPGPDRHHPYMFGIDGMVYAGMGHGGPNIYSDWYRFDPISNNWTILQSFPGEARVAGTQFSHGNKGYVLSGDGDDHSWMATGEFWEYDPSADEWTELTPHPGISRWAPGSFVIDNTVYFVGGENRQTAIVQATGFKFSLDAQGPPTGLETTKDLVADIALYPVPAGNILQIKTDVTIQQVDIYGSTGQLVHSAQMGNQPLDVSHLSKGVYFAVLRDAEGKVHRKKFVKQ